MVMKVLPMGCLADDETGQRTRLTPSRQMSGEQDQLHHRCNPTEALNRQRQKYKITPRNNFSNTVLQESSLYIQVLVFQREKFAEMNYFPQSLELYLAHFPNIVTNFMNISLKKNTYISIHMHHLLFCLLLSNKKAPYNPV